MKAIHCGMLLRFVCSKRSTRSIDRPSCLSSTIRRCRMLCAVYVLLPVLGGMTTPNPFPIVGVIGLGKMGSAFARNLLAGGYRVVGFDANGAALEAFAEEGLERASSVQEVAELTDAVITMLPTDAALLSVSNDPSTGLLRHMKAGSLHISCSTVSPGTSRRLAQWHKEHGLRYVAAPVFARPDGVARKQAYFVCGGMVADVEEARPILLATGSQVFHFGSGDVGAGNVVKLAGNFLIAAAIEAMGEACALVEQQGLDRAEVMNMLSSTIFDCLIYKGYGNRISRRDHKPGGFSLDLGLKDVALLRETAQECGTPMQLGSLLHDRFLAAQRRGRGDLDWSALALSASEEAGVDVTDALMQVRDGQH